MANTSYHISIYADEKGVIQDVEFNGKPARPADLSETGVKINDVKSILLVKHNPWCVLDPHTGRLWCL